MIGTPLDILEGLVSLFWEHLPTMLVFLAGIVAGWILSDNCYRMDAWLDHWRERRRAKR